MQSKLTGFESFKTLEQLVDNRLGDEAFEKALLDLVEEAEEKAIAKAVKESQKALAECEKQKTKLEKQMKKEEKKTEKMLAKQEKAKQKEEKKLAKQAEKDKIKAFREMAEEYVDENIGLVDQVFLPKTTAYYKEHIEGNQYVKLSEKRKYKWLFEQEKNIEETKKFLKAFKPLGFLKKYFILKDLETYGEIDDETFKSIKEASTKELNDVILTL